MSDENQNPKAIDDGSDEEIDIESLSSDEKAAFEKIMAEIAAAETENDSDASPGDLKSEDNGPASTDTADHISSPETEKSEVSRHVEETGEEPLTDDQQGALDQIMAEIESKNGPEQPPADDQQAALDQVMAEINSKKGPEENADTDTDSSADDADAEDELDDDQQAALDQIMAEINSKKGPEENADTDTDNSADDADAEDELDDDQQAALDQIMAEINSKKGPEENADTDTDNSADDADAEDELNDDQQAALDQIMAEINSKKGPEENADTDTDNSADDADAEDELNDDQQAALDQIMAEINSKKGPEENADTDTDSSVDDDAEDQLDDSQQAALDQILAEINAKKKDGDREEEPESDSTKDTTESGDNGQGLSLEEFNNELSMLLSPESDSSAKTDADEKPKPLESTKTTGETTSSDSGTVSEIDAPEGSGTATGPDDYPILKEVDTGASEEQVEPKKKGKKKARVSVKAVSPSWVKKAAYAIGFIALAAILMGGAYWIYDTKLRFLVTDNDKQLKLVVSEESPETIAQIRQQAVQPVAQQPEPLWSPVTEPAVIINKTTQINPLQSLEAELSAGCTAIQSKISEIDDLMAYYTKGIAEEANALESAVQSAQYTTYKEASDDPKIELTMRAIQRRQVYVTKLASPLAQLHRAYEELLYFQRYAHLYDLLGKYTSGVAVSDFEQKASHALRIHLEKIGTLTVDDIEIEKPSLESIWNTVTKKAVQKVVKTKPTRPQNPLSASIAREICQGDFSRKSLITELSMSTATCLIKWSGRDLYLNELKELSPSVAKTLAQWQGEWLSLNGLKELSPESAVYLASWPGKRLSLNGVVRLSSKATTNLSKWKGDQLEMIGLEEIGPWKNYGTRLFLSENLKRRLEGN
jgi:hypothetical protein